MTGRRGALVGTVVAALVLACGPASSPSTSAAPSIAGSGAIGSGSPDPGQAQSLVAAFLERVHDPGARYRLDQKLTVVIGTTSSEAVSHTDAAGADIKVVSDSTQGGTTTHSEYLQAGGTAYQRTGDQDWRVVGPVDGQPALYPYLSATDMRSAGRAIKSGELLDSFSLVATIPIGAAVAESLGVTGGSASVVVFDCFLRGDGTPVKVEAGLQLDAADGSAAGYLAIEQDYIEFGGDIVVDPPIS